MIVSKVHGTFEIREDRIRYQDLDSRNGTFLGLGSGRQLLGKADGFLEVFDKTALCIGNLEQAEHMVLLLYSTSTEREMWKREPLERPVTEIGGDSGNHICLPGQVCQSSTVRSINRQKALCWKTAAAQTGFWSMEAM